MKPAEVVERLRRIERRVHGLAARSLTTNALLSRELSEVSRDLCVVNDHLDRHGMEFDRLTGGAPNV